MPTPVIYSKTLYVLANNGVFHAYELATGKEIYETRVPMLGSGFNASPVAADGKIYVSGEDGDLMVLAAGTTFKHIATNQMGEPLMATPALSQGVLYVRTPTSLVAVGRADKPATDAERARRGIGADRPKNFIPWTELATAGATGGLTFSITSPVPEHAAFAGTWIASVRGVVNPMQVTLTLEGKGVSGELINGPTTLKIIDGTVSGNRISFSVVAPTGNRTVTFNGTLDNDEIAFERTVRLHEGAAASAAGGAGLFGINGAPSFVAKRTSK